MPRHPRRVLATVAFVAAATLVAAQSGPQGFNKLDAKPPADQSRLGQLREGKLKTGGPDLKTNQKLLKDVAKYHVYKVTDKDYYLAPETGDLKPREVSATFDQVMIDVTNQLLQPGPGSTFSTVQQEYIAEFGVAMNEAIRDVLKSKQPTPVRVNTGRLLALGAKSGAPAFAATIHELLTDSFPLNDGKPGKTPPELFLYAIRAAGNLFASYDAVWQLNPDARSQFRHSFPEKDQIALARDLLGLLEKGPGVAELAAIGDPDKPIIKAVRTDLPVGSDDPPAEKQATLESAVATPEQAAVTGYYRRAVAIAVSKIRPDQVGELGQAPLRPGVAIARIAVGDSQLNPSATIPEVAEAVLGLCYLSPSQKLNIPEVLATIAGGSRLVVQGYNNRETDPAVARTAKLVPWRVYAERLTAAANHLATQGAKNPRWKEHQAAVAQLVSILKEDVATPISRNDSTARPSVERLVEFQRGRSGVPPAERSLYTDDPTFVLTPRQGG